jgi:hypothetical protein
MNIASTIAFIAGFIACILTVGAGIVFILREIFYFANILD